MIGKHKSLSGGNDDESVDANGNNEINVVRDDSNFRGVRRTVESTTTDWCELIESDDDIGANVTTIVRPRSSRGRVPERDHLATTTMARNSPNQPRILDQQQSFSSPSDDVNSSNNKSKDEGFLSADDEATTQRFLFSCHQRHIEEDATTTSSSSTNTADEYSPQLSPNTGHRPDNQQSNVDINDHSRKDLTAVSACSYKSPSPSVIETTNRMKQVSITCSERTNPSNSTLDTERTFSNEKTFRNDQHLRNERTRNCYNDDGSDIHAGNRSNNFQRGSLLDRRQSRNGASSTQHSMPHNHQSTHALPTLNDNYSTTFHQKNSRRLRGSNRLHDSNEYQTADRRSFGNRQNIRQPPQKPNWPNTMPGRQGSRSNRKFNKKHRQTQQTYDDFLLNDEQRDRRSMRHISDGFESDRTFQARNNRTRNERGYRRGNQETRDMKRKQNYMPFKNNTERFHKVYEGAESSDYDFDNGNYLISPRDTRNFPTNLSNQGGRSNRLPLFDEQNEFKKDERFRTMRMRSDNRRGGRLGGNYQARPSRGRARIDFSYEQFKGNNHNNRNRSFDDNSSKRNLNCLHSEELMEDNHRRSDEIQRGRNPPASNLSSNRKNFGISSVNNDIYSSNRKSKVSLQHHSKTYNFKTHQWMNAQDKSRYPNDHSSSVRSMPKSTRMESAYRHPLFRDCDEPDPPMHDHLRRRYDEQDRYYKNEIRRNDCIGVERRQHHNAKTQEQTTDRQIQTPIIKEEDVTIKQDKYKSASTKLILGTEADLPSRIGNNNKATTCEHINNLSSNKHTHVATSNASLNTSTQNQTVNAKSLVDRSFSSNSECTEPSAYSCKKSEAENTTSSIDSSQHVQCINTVDSSLQQQLLLNQQLRQYAANLQQQNEQLQSIGPNFCTNHLNMEGQPPLQLNTTGTGVMWPHIPHSSPNPQLVYPSLLNQPSKETHQNDQQPSFMNYPLQQHNRIALIGGGGGHAQCLPLCFTNLVHAQPNVPMQAYILNNEYVTPTALQQGHADPINNPQQQTPLLIINQPTQQHNSEFGTTPYWNQVQTASMQSLQNSGYTPEQFQQAQAALAMLQNGQTSMLAPTGPTPMLTPSVPTAYPSADQINVMMAADPVYFSQLLRLNDQCSTGLQQASINNVRTNNLSSDQALNTIQLNPPLEQRSSHPLAGRLSEPKVSNNESNPYSIPSNVFPPRKPIGQGDINSVNALTDALNQGRLYYSASSSNEFQQSSNMSRIQGLPTGPDSTGLSISSSKLNNNNNTGQDESNTTC